MVRPDDILSFWLDELDPKQHFNGGAELDAEITRRFGDAWADAQNGAFGLWLTYPNGTLAYVILNDQFPRNMFRDTAKAFSSDGLARAAAKMQRDRNEERENQFRAGLSQAKLAATKERAQMQVELDRASARLKGKQTTGLLFIFTGVSVLSHFAS